jgi:hypothetical protein
VGKGGQGVAALARQTFRHARQMTVCSSMAPTAWARRIQRGASIGNRGGGLCPPYASYSAASARVVLDDEVGLHLHRVGHFAELRNAGELSGQLVVVDLDVVGHVALL